MVDINSDLLDDIESFDIFTDDFLLDPGKNEIENTLDIWTERTFDEILNELNQ